jgi:signal peptide peptidase SppA
MMHRFLDRPLAIHPQVSIDLLEHIKSRALADEAMATEAASKFPLEVRNGVAIIRISGVLVHSETLLWDETSYSSIGDSIGAAWRDRAARAIALHISSPGGEVSGLFDLADALHTARGTKPMWAIVDDHAYSAAYALASTADRILVPRTGGTGSIGVVTLHLDMSKALDQDGIKVTTVQYGAHKTDLSRFKPLSEEAHERLQADVNMVGEMFVELVARNRNISKARVRHTEAATFMGQQGVDAGLADAVLSPHQAFNQLVGTLT